METTLEARLAALEQAGLLAWNGERLPPLAPVAQTQGPVTVAELLIEERACPEVEHEPKLAHDPLAGCQRLVEKEDV